MELGKVPMADEDRETTLGMVLYESMERLDPSDGVEWPDLTERERDFYRLAAKAVADALVLLPNHHVESREKYI